MRTAILAVCLLGAFGCDGDGVEMVERALAGRNCCGAGIDNFCLQPPATAGCDMTFPGGYCDPDGDASFTDADWVRGYFEHEAACTGVCPCAPEINNFCHHAPGTYDCPMTAAGGYCDPNGDGSYADADWSRGYFEYRDLCPEPALTIRSLRVNPREVDRCGAVEVRWEVIGADHISVWRLNPIGQVAAFLTDPPGFGSWQLSLPCYHVDYASFMLFAYGPDGSLVTGSADVVVHCPYVYFFGEPTGEACPLAAAELEASEYQAFEGGFMLWRSPHDQIYVLVTDGHRLRRFDDNYDPGDPPPPTMPAPPGFFAPTDRFAAAWSEHPELAGTLGWAIAPSVTYTLQSQRSGAYRYARTYLSLPDGSVVFLVEDTWGNPEISPG